MNVTPLFSIPLAQVNIGPLDPITEAYVKNLEYPHEAAGHDHTDNKYILNQPQMKNLKDCIQEQLNYFAHEVLATIDDYNWEIQNSWCNRHGNGEYNTRHWHSNAMISGVYYIDCDSNTGNIVFSKSKGYHNLFTDTVRPDFKNSEEYYNTFNTESYSICPKRGDLIMFPSHLEHEVMPNLSKSTIRYSIAFNAWCRGTVGDGTSRIIT